MTPSPPYFPQPHTKPNGLFPQYASLARRTNYASRSFSPSTVDASEETQEKNASSTETQRHQTNTTKVSTGGGEDAKEGRGAAEAESKAGSAAEGSSASSLGVVSSRDVFEQAVIAAPFCLELWEAFVADVISEGTGAGGGNDAEDTRR